MSNERMFLIGEFIKFEKVRVGPSLITGSGFVTELGKHVSYATVGELNITEPKDFSELLDELDVPLANIVK